MVYASSKLTFLTAVTGELGISIAKKVFTYFFSSLLNFFLFNYSFHFFHSFRLSLSLYLLIFQTWGVYILKTTIYPFNIKPSLQPPPPLSLSLLYHFPLRASVARSNLRRRHTNTHTHKQRLKKKGKKTTLIKN